MISFYISFSCLKILLSNTFILLFIINTLLEMDNIRWSYNTYFLESIKTDGVIISTFLKVLKQMEL